MAKQQVCSPSASAITNAEARKEPNNTTLRMYMHRRQEMHLE